MALTATVLGEDTQARTWIKLFNESTYFYSQGSSVQQTTDGGYIVTGAGVNSLIKTDVNGNKIWNRTFGESSYGAECTSARQTTDGGYIVIGAFDRSGELIKTDSNGIKTWNRTLSGHSIEQTTDGGYIIVGSIDKDNHLIKTDSNGNIIWSKFVSLFGTVQETTDGGYIFTGPTGSALELIRFDSSGSTLWEKSFMKCRDTGCGSANGYSAQQTTDGGYIVTGDRQSYDSGNSGNKVVWLIKTDFQGNEQWNNSFGQNAEGYSIESTSRSVQQTTDGGYIIAGTTQSPHSASSTLVWLIKTDSQGAKQWDKTFEGGEGYSVQQTTDGGYIISGRTNDGHIMLIKTDADGNG